LYFLALPFGAAIACAASATSFEGGAGGVGGTGPSASVSFPPTPPDQRVDCTTSIDGWCANPDIGCVTHWSQAQLPASWAQTGDGCARIATQECAGFFIAEGEGLEPRIRNFYAANTGDLFAIVMVFDPNTSTCTAGPPGFTNPLVLDCEPPTKVVCAYPNQGGDAGDAGEAGDGGYSDGGLIDGARGD
jgi:hypothetical protein